MYIYNVYVYCIQNIQYNRNDHNGIITRIVNTKHTKKNLYKNLGFLSPGAFVRGAFVRAPSTFVGQWG